MTDIIPRYCNMLITICMMNHTPYIIVVIKHISYIKELILNWMSSKLITNIVKINTFSMRKVKLSIQIIHWIVTLAHIT